MTRWLVRGAAVLLVLIGGTIAVLSYRFRPKAEREDPAAVLRDIQTLTAQRDSLRAQVFESAARSELLRGRPAGDVVIGLPAPFVEAVVREVIQGWFHDVDLRLPPIRVRKAGELKARVSVLGRRTLGAYELEVNLRNVRARLQPGTPVMRFSGDGIRLELPVRLAGGSGIARVKIDWESKGIAGPVCGDLSAEREVTGEVRPRLYNTRGQIRLAAKDGRIVADPAFPGLALRIFVDPAPRSIAVLDSLLTTKGGLCGVALGKARASERIQQLIGRGFNVKIPQRFFRPVELPIAFETALPIQNRAFALQVTPSALVTTPSFVWMGANVSLAPRAATISRTGKTPATP